MKEAIVIVGGFLAFFGMLIGACIHSDNLEHTLKMECVKQQGEWIGKTCIFRR